MLIGKSEYFSNFARSWEVLVVMQKEKQLIQRTEKQNIPCATVQLAHGINWVRKPQGWLKN